MQEHPKSHGQSWGAQRGDRGVLPHGARPAQPAHGDTTVMGARCPPMGQEPPKTPPLGLAVTAPPAIATPCPQALHQALPRRRREPREAIPGGIPGGIPAGNREQPAPPPRGQVLPVPRLCSVAAEPMPPPAAPASASPWHGAGDSPTGTTGTPQLLHAASTGGVPSPPCSPWVPAGPCSPLGHPWSWGPRL